MKIGTGDVRHIATLAELEISEAELPSLAADMERIVTFVEQLPDIPVEDRTSVTVGPSALRLREDVVDPVPLARPPEANAPAWRDGFFVVPALDGLGEDE